MKREVVKICIAALSLGVILGGLYYMIRHMKDSGGSREESVSHYWQEKMQLPRAQYEGEEEFIDELDSPADDAAAPELQPVAELTVKGKVYNGELAAVRQVEVSVIPDEKDAVSLERAEDGWLTASPLKGVSFVSIQSPGRKLSVDGMKVAGSGGLVRFNWVKGPEKSRGGVYFTDVVAVEAGETLEVYCRGRAQLPDHSVLLLSLNYEGMRHSGEVFEVDGATFSGVIKPDMHGFPSGRYQLVLDFNSLHQPPDVLEALKTNVPTLTVTQELVIGDPAHREEERLAENQEMKAVFRKAYFLRRMFSVFFQLGMTVKGTYWKASEASERYFPRGVPDVARNGTLNLKVWRFWIDEYFVPRVEACRAELEKNEIPINTQASVYLRNYMKELKRFVMIGSMLVYSSAGLDPDERDYCNVTLSLPDAFQVVREKLMGKRLTGRVGLERAIAELLQ